MDFVGSMQKIWNKPACEAKQGLWSNECMNKRTWWSVASEIAALCVEVAWIYLYTVLTVILVVIGMYKVMRYRRELRELSEQIGRQQIQVQQQNTNVIVKTTKTPQVEHEIELKTFELNEGSHRIVQSSTSTPTKCKICDSTDHGSRKCPIYNRIKALGCFETNKEVAGQKSKKDESDSEPDDKPLACKGFI